MTIRCLTCKKEIHNDTDWHCPDCKEKNARKKMCHHEPASKDCNTTCMHCGIKLEAFAWRPV